VSVGDRVEGAGVERGADHRGPGLSPGVATTISNYRVYFILGKKCFSRIKISS
jgi:hypothetical protein